MTQARRAKCVAIVLMGMSSAAQAGSLPRPVCGRNEVLDVVADDIARHGIAAVIMPGAIGEVPAAAPDTVRCSVRIRTTYFNTNRFGYTPQVRLSVLEFTVRAGRNGLFVDAVGDPR